MEENVTAGESARVVAEVRDQYGNPLGGVRVDANATGWEPAPRNTTSDGRVTFEFNSTGYGGETVQLNFTTERLTDEELSALDAGTPTNATANVSVSAPSGGGGGGSGGTAAGLWPLKWESLNITENTDAGFTFPSACTPSECTVNASDANVLTLSVNTSEETDGASVSFSVNNSSVARLTDGNQTKLTNSTGVARTELSLQNNGTVNVVAASGGGRTPLQITVQNLTSTGPLGGSTTSDAGGPGSGGAGEYTEDSPTETFSVSNGLWTGITCTDQFVLSNGRPASRPDGDGNVIQLTTRIEDSTGENYTIDVRLERESDGSWDKKRITIYDGHGDKDSADLTPAAADKVYGSGQTDLFELSNYDDPNTGSDSFTDFVGRLQGLDNDRPVTWQTSRMIGRVDVSLQCDDPSASNVTTIDGSTPSGSSRELRFKLQVDAGTTKEVTNISITSPGYGGNPPDENGLDKIQRTGADPEGRFTPSDSTGVNQSGELSVGRVNIDGSTYNLDTNAIFADGANLTVEIGEFNGNGGDTLTYNIADSVSDADMIVTFNFTDGTKHEVYIRVTNVDT